MTEFDRWLKNESDKEKEKECKLRDNECYGCPYEDECQEEELMNSLDEW